LTRCQEQDLASNLWQVFVAEFSVSVGSIAKAELTQLMTTIVCGADVTGHARRGAAERSRSPPPADYGTRQSTPVRTAAKFLILLAAPQGTI
jgi:hypothetical protein